MKQINGVPVVDKRKLPSRLVSEEKREFYAPRLDFLPPKQKIVMQKWLQNKSQKQIADELNVNIGTVSRQITSACTKLDGYINSDKPLPIIYNGKPYSFIETKCSKEFIESHLVYLPPKLSKIAKQYFIDRKTHFEIAEEFNVKPKSAIEYMYDVKNTLEQYLAGAPLPLVKNGKRLVLKRTRYWDNDFVMNHLQYLSPLQSKIAPLFYIENMNYEEIAEKLNTTVGNIRTNTNIARRKLIQMKNGTFNYAYKGKNPVPHYYLKKIGYDKDFVEKHLYLLTPLQKKLAEGLLLDGKSGVQIAKELSVIQSNVSVYMGYIKKKFDKANKQEQE